MEITVENVCASCKMQVELDITRSLVSVNTKGAAEEVNELLGKLPIVYVKDYAVFGVRYEDTRQDLNADKAIATLVSELQEICDNNGWILWSY